MAQFIVRNVEDSLKERLQEQAHRHGHSMEEEIRAILRNAVQEEATVLEPLGARLVRRFHKVGLDEPIPELRGHPAIPAEFEPSP